MNATRAKDASTEWAGIRPESDNECSVTYADPVVNVIHDQDDRVAGAAAANPTPVTCPCGTVFSPRPRDVRRGGNRGRYCSQRCARQANARKSHGRPQSGALNPNWRGGRASRPYHSYVKRFKQSNPEKVSAHGAVQRAIRKGVLVRPGRCDSCLRDCRPDAHHWDYSKPLSVEWLCRRCHAAVDAVRAAMESPRIALDPQQQISGGQQRGAGVVVNFVGTHRQGDLQQGAVDSFADRSSSVSSRAKRDLHTGQSAEVSPFAPATKVAG